MFSFTWDDLFAYTTNHQVQVRDRRLGALRLLLISAAFAWVVVYNVLANQGWARKKTLSGASLLSANNPKINSAGVDNCYCYGGKLSPLCGSSNCTDDFSNFADLPYCSDSNISYFSGNEHKKSCIRIDEADSVSKDGDGLYLRTTIEYQYQQFLHNVQGGPLEPVNPGGDLWGQVPHPTLPFFFNREFYVVDVLRYTILFEHGVKEEHISSLSIDTGVLKSKNKAQCAELYGEDSTEMYEREVGDDTFFCDIKPMQTQDCRSCGTESCKKKECGYDVFDIKTLLLASGEFPTLEAPLDMLNSGSSKVPLRARGARLEVQIQYTDKAFDKWFPGKNTYYYNVDLFMGPANTQRLTQNDFAGKRTVFASNGLSIKPIVQGELHKFEPQVLLVCLTSILGLLSVATLIVESFMLKVLPLKAYYSSIKYDRSPRMGSLYVSYKDVKKLDQKAVVELVEKQARRSETANSTDNSIRPTNNSWSKMADNDEGGEERGGISRA